MKNKTGRQFPYLFLLSLLLSGILLLMMIWRTRYFYVSHDATISAAMDLMGLITMTVFIGGCYLEHSFEPMANRAFRIFLFSVVVTCLCDGCGWMLDRLNEPLYIGGNMFFNSLYSLMNAVTIYFFARFLTAFVPIRPPWFRAYLHALLVYIALLGAALLLNVKLGFFHSVVNGVYVRGPLFVLQLIGDGGFLLIILVDVLYKRMDTEEKVGILVCISVPLLLAVGQNLLFHVSLAAYGSCIAAVVIYVHAHNRRAHLILEQRAEQEQQQTAVMLSQIQPHFLYNSLNAIVALCDIDPQLAKQTTINFSTFLERNLEDLSEREPIPFEKELDHVDAYLQIEQVRFGERLNVEYEIGAVDFRIPSLTLQPLVENAVKHGLHKRPEGGTVVIRSEEVKNGWEVTVEDDGVGFDPNNVVIAGHGVGIASIRRRVEGQVGGRLTVTSEINKGTKAVLFIPKEDTDDNLRH